jgi:hypothetical protein
MMARQCKLSKIRKRPSLSVAPTDPKGNLSSIFHMWATLQPEQKPKSAKRDLEEFNELQYSHWS